MKWNVGLKITGLVLVGCLAWAGHGMAVTLSRTPAPAPADSIPGDLEALAATHPALVQGLLTRINLDYPGLDSVRTLARGKKWAPACAALVRYYRRKSAARASQLGVDPGPASAGQLATADDVLKNVFTFQEVTGEQPKRPDGHLNWTDKGPRHDVEWAYFLNRQGYFNDLVAAYRTSRDPKYARKLNTLVSDWVLSNPPPSRKQSIPTWRELEVGLRLTSGNWPRTFYGFMGTDAFSPVACILMLSSVWEQANYLVLYHRMHSNWAAMELNGLGAAAVYWPEFRDAKGWFSHATRKMVEEQAFEVYPDGVQNELTSHYHEVAMNNFAQFRDLAEKYGQRLPEAFSRTLEKMYGYIAYTVRPSGYGLLNNDADLDFTRPLIAEAARHYDREDWTYIATGGTHGKKPMATSIFFPWAGQMVMRSGWGPTAQWAFFDVGPWGHAHQHNDKLHLSVSAFGHDWLVDGGRYYYKWDEWRRYFLSSAAHNLVLVDGAGQIPTAPIATRPRKSGFSCQPTLDFCMGTYGDGFSADIRAHATDSGVIHSTHTRAVMYVKGKYWVVFDHFSGVRGRRLEPLWHFAPECRVGVSGGSVTARDSAGATLQIIASDAGIWKTTTLRGQQPPEIQGWYSPAYNEKVPNDCVRYQMTATDTAATFAWVIYPASQGTPGVKVTELKAPRGASRLRISIPGLPDAEVAVRFYGTDPVPLSDGFSLDGDCYLKEGTQPPVVAGGFILDRDHHPVTKTPR